MNLDDPLGIEAGALEVAVDVGREDEAAVRIRRPSGGESQTPNEEWFGR